MIVSASYKTDVPAFYGDWFVRRLDAGFCRMVNPYGGQEYEVALGRRDVDGFVFWTKNAGPFLQHLQDIRGRGYAFVVHYTITGYPRALEYSVTDSRRAIAHMQGLARDFGARVPVWRYDPVLITSLTPPEWHVENFAALARALSDTTDEVVISFAHIYRKTRRNLDAAARAFGFTWRDASDVEKRRLTRRLATIAAEQGLRLTICAQPQYLAPGAEPARCIDAGRLGDVVGRAIAAPERGNRSGCLCHASRDIGAYDTCPHGCVYCYAVQHRGLARRRYRRHDPGGAFLCPPTDRGSGEAGGRRTGSG